MLLVLLAPCTPHDVVAEAERHVDLGTPWLDDLGRLLLFFSSFYLHKENLNHKHKHEKKGSYAENREITRRVAWIAEQNRPFLESLENKRYKVDQHPKGPELEPEVTPSVGS